MFNIKNNKCYLVQDKLTKDTLTINRYNYDRRKNSFKIFNWNDKYVLNMHSLCTKTNIDLIDKNTNSYYRSVGTTTNLIPIKYAIKGCLSEFKTNSLGNLESAWDNKVISLFESKSELYSSLRYCCAKIHELYYGLTKDLFAICNLQKDELPIERDGPFYFLHNILSNVILVEKDLQKGIEKVTDIYDVIPKSYFKFLKRAKL